MGTLADIQRQIDDVALSGRMAELGASTSFSCRAGTLVGAGRTGGGWFARNVDNLFLAPFGCGALRGLVLGVATGNYKDDGTSVASAVAAMAILGEFASDLTSSADIAPALRRGAIAAHERVRAANDVPIDRRTFTTMMGRRSNLHGIGCSLTAVAIQASQLHGIHIGEGRAFLLRDGTARKLTLEHTLDHDPSYRERTRRDPDGAFPMAEHVVMNVLGLADDLPRMDVFRTELLDGDAVVIGNLALAPEFLTETTDVTEPHELSSKLAEAMTRRFPSAPATVGVVQLGSAAL